MEVIPDEVKRKLALLILGAIVFAGLSALLIIKRKKLAFEIWIPALAICVLSAVGLGSIAVCVAALFVVAR